MVKKGDTVIYKGEYNKPLVVISEPYQFDGKTIVTCRPAIGAKSNRRQGMYNVESLAQVRTTPHGERRNHQWKKRAK